MHCAKCSNFNEISSGVPYNKFTFLYCKYFFVSSGGSFKNENTGTQSFLAEEKAKRLSVSALTISIGTSPAYALLSIAKSLSPFFRRISISVSACFSPSAYRNPKETGLNPFFTASFAI